MITAPHLDEVRLSHRQSDRFPAVLSEGRTADRRDTFCAVWDVRVRVYRDDTSGGSSTDTQAEQPAKQFGRLDIVLANAGISTSGLLSEMSEEDWHTMIEVNLTGVWKTVRASVKNIIAGGRGGSIVLTSSSAGLRNWDNIGH